MRSGYQSFASPRGWWRRLPADAALNLAVFRIVVGLLLLATSEVQGAVAWAALPPSMAAAPAGWGWAWAWLPPGAAAAQVARAVLDVCAGLAVLGCFTRIAFAGATLAALYLLALPLASGLPFHYHHLVWFSALCAAGPSGDALSIDRWRQRRRGEPAPRRSPVYGVPIRSAWLLLGVIFWFPGLWKLRESGLAWITSDNLRNQLYWRWLTTPGLWPPPVRVDRFPALMHAGAAAVVLLELTFGVAIWSRRLRMAALAAALVFHAFARVLMGIDFSGLWLTYVVLVDWDRLLAGWRAWRAGAPAAGPGAIVETGAPLRRVAPSLVVGLLLVAGAVEAGARGLATGWPFACYPTFQHRALSEMPVLQVALVDAGGAESMLDLESMAPTGDQARERMLGLRLLAAASHDGAPARFAAYWSRIAAQPALRQRLAGWHAARFYDARISTLPEARERPAQRRRLVYELPLSPASSATLPP